jgi:hypothetical protein
MPDSAINTIPSVPVTVPVKYSVIAIAAMITRINRSAFPMFFFICAFCSVRKILNGQHYPGNDADAQQTYTYQFKPVFVHNDSKVRRIHVATCNKRYTIS